MSFKSTNGSPPLGKSQLARYRATSLLAAMLAIGWSATAEGQFAGQILLISPDIQSGSPVTIAGFSGNAARREAASSETAGVCGLNTIIKRIDSTSSQFLTLAFTKAQISAVTIASSLQGTVFYQVDLTGVVVENVARSDSTTPLNTNITVEHDLSETITLLATTIKYTYQPVTVTGQKAGPPTIFGWNCATNKPF